MQGCGVYDLAKCLSDQKPPPPFNQSLKFDFDKRLREFPPSEDSSTIQHDYMVFESSTKGHKAPPLLLLHELPGLTKKTLHFANWLSAQGFTVYVPVLFGKVGERSNARGFINYFMSQEWIPFVETTLRYRHMDGRVEESNGETRPIHQWLRSFIKEEIEVEHSSQAIGVIGMCLTGAVPLALLDNQKIQRIVVAQPTLPFMFWGTEYDKKSLDLSELERNNAIKRVKDQGTKILGTRFLNDCIAMREKHIRMQELFGENFIDGEVRLDSFLEGKAHSTLVTEWPGNDNNDHPTSVLRKKVVEFLAEPHKESSQLSSTKIGTHSFQE